MENTSMDCDTLTSASDISLNTPQPVYSDVPLDLTTVPILEDNTNDDDLTLSCNLWRIVNVHYVYILIYCIVVLPKFQAYIKHNDILEINIFI